MDIKGYDGGDIIHNDLLQTGPGTIGGRYLRSFWQPVHRSADIAAGTAKPIRIMSEDFTLFRGENGAAHVVAERCRHRGAKLSMGRVEGETIRCPYHGWQYDGAGRCIDQPVETRPFCEQATIKAYPTREYLGLVFAYLGEGAPPSFQRSVDFEDDRFVKEIGTVTWPCNYFAQTENTFDFSHLRYLHRQFAYQSAPQKVTVEQTAYGLRLHCPGLSGAGEACDSHYFHMPNTQEYRTPPLDGEKTGFIARSWRVPRDDECFSRFDIRIYPLEGRDKEEFLAQRKARFSAATSPGSVPEIAQAIVRGERPMPDPIAEAKIFGDEFAMVLVQDCAVMAGLSPMASRVHDDLLGPTDVGIAWIRRLWTQELRAFAQGRAPKQWTRPEVLWATL